MDEPVTDSLEQLLKHLEHVTEDLTIQLTATPDLERIHGGIRDRGTLVARLSQLLEHASPVAYSTYNRVIVLHVQGEQIRNRLAELRACLALQTTSKHPHQAYRHCLQGMIG